MARTAPKGRRAPQIIRPDAHPDVASVATPTSSASTGFNRVLPGFTGFYWVLLGFTGFYWVSKAEPSSESDQFEMKNEDESHRQTEFAIQSRPQIQKNNSTNECRASRSRAKTSQGSKNRLSLMAAGRDKQNRKTPAKKRNNGPQQNKRAENRILGRRSFVTPATTSTTSATSSKTSAPNLPRPFLPFQRSICFLLFSFSLLSSSILPWKPSVMDLFQRSTGFYWVLLGFTGLQWVSRGLTGSFLGLTGFPRVLLNCTQFSWVLRGFTGFF